MRTRFEALRHLVQDARPKRAIVLPARLAEGPERRGRRLSRLVLPGERVGADHLAGGRIDRYNRERPREVSLWNFLDPLHLTTEQINTYSAILLVLGMIGIMLLMWRTYARKAAPSPDLLLPASLAIIGWLFFINKVYSPQYSLWLAVLVALLGAPSVLAVAFASAELPLFGASFIALFLYWSQNPALPWFFDQVLLPVMVWHEATVLAIIVWAAWRIGRPRESNVLGAKARGDDPCG